MIVKSSRRFVASSYVQLFRVLISQSMYPVKWWQEWCSALYPGPGVCRGTSQCCSESEHWRGCSLTHPHQMAASSPHALYHQVETHHCHLLICSYTLKMLICCMHEIFIDEGRRYDGHSFYLELWKPWGFHLILDIWHIFTRKHAGCWLVSQVLLSPSLGAYFEIIMHLVQL